MVDTATFADVDLEGIPNEVSQLLDAAVTRAQAGEVIGSADGVQFRQGKTRTMVNYKGVELPERTRVYDKFGMPSDVPTAQLTRMLSKPRADAPGERAFFPRPPAGKEIVYIPETCEWCLKGGVRKRFMDMDDLENHCEMLHPREYGRKIRREDNNRRGASVDDVLQVLSMLTPEQKQALLGEKRGPGRPRKEAE